MTQSKELTKVLHRMENYKTNLRYDQSELIEPIDKIVTNFRKNLRDSLKELQELNVRVLQNENLKCDHKLNLTKGMYENLHKKGFKYKNSILEVLPHNHNSKFLRKFDTELPLTIDISSQLQNIHSPVRRTPSPFKKCLNRSNVFRARTRFFLMILVLFCLASVWSNILCFNFTVICINPSENDDDGSGSGSMESSEEDFGIPKRKKGFPELLKPPITMVVAAGALVANFPAVYLANRFGIRSIFPIFGFLSAISTGLMPLCIDWGFGYVIAARIFQGIAFACNFPVIGTFTSRWTYRARLFFATVTSFQNFGFSLPTLYYKQSGLFVSTLVAFIQLAPVITNPVSGALCTSSLGWQAVFYGHAMVGAILFLLFVIFYRNNPEKHPFVSHNEASKIARGKSTRLKDAMKNIPYRDILKTMSVWAIWVAAMGNFFCVNLVFLFQPTYLHHVLGFGVGETGATAALPPLLQFGLKLAAGFVSDKIHFLGETAKVKVFNSVAFFGASTLLVVLANIPPTRPTLSFIVLVAAEGCLGIATGGFFKNGALVSKHFSHFVTGNIALSIGFTILIVSFMVNGIAKDNTPEQWRAIFIITACVLIWTNLFFVCVGSAKPAPWTMNHGSSSFSETSSPTGSAMTMDPGYSPKPILKPQTTTSSRLMQNVTKKVGWENQKKNTNGNNLKEISRRESMKNILVIDF